MKNLKIWVIGTDDFKLNKDPKIYQKFITNWEYEGESINSLNRIFSEYVGMYYVWKNQIKSDYVGFCHYRRLIDNYLCKPNTFQYYYHYYPMFLHDHFRESINTEIPYIYYFFGRIGTPKFVIDDCIEWLKTQKILSYSRILELINPKLILDIAFVGREIYLTDWNLFNKLMEFLDNYIQFIAKKHNINSKEDWKAHVFEDLIKYYRVHHPPYGVCIYQKEEEYNHIFDEDGGFSKKCNCWRVYSYVIEHLISIFILCNNHFIDIKNKPTPYNNMSMKRDQYLTIQKLLEKYHPKDILELGGGLSSLVLKNPITIDHLKSYTDIPTFPLIIKDYEINRKIYKNCRVYDGLEDFIEDKQFDFILIDGPYGQQNYSRIQMVEIYKHLVPGGIMVIHDADRFGEQQSIQLIENTYQIIPSNDKQLMILCKKQQ